MLKDEKLIWVLQRGYNTAQFVSFGPPNEQRFHGVREYSQGARFTSVEDAVSTLFERSLLKAVDIRTFLIDKPEGNPFPKDIRHRDEAVQLVRSFLAQGYYVIVNERIPIEGSGRFGGVLWGDILQGAIDATPRCVDERGSELPVLSLGRRTGIEILQRIYRCILEFPFGFDERVEFSVHIDRVGYYHAHQIIWQVDRCAPEVTPRAPSHPFWPNRVSEYLGDKVFGLLLADTYGLLVPDTTVIGKVLPQFRFGKPTHSHEPLWIRTAPKSKAPGKYATRRRWENPFKLMHEEDPDDTKIASLMVVDGVKPVHSGALVTDADGKLVIEGVKGEGDLFMTGKVPPEALPSRTVRAVEDFYKRTLGIFGEHRAEWVFDDEEVWCLQLNLGRTASYGEIVFPGEPNTWREFPTSCDIEELRALVPMAREEGFGIILRGNAGITGHFAEILCNAKIPSRIEP